MDVPESKIREEVARLRDRAQWANLSFAERESQGKLEAAESRASRAEEALKQSEALVRMLRERSGPKKLDAAETRATRAEESRDRWQKTAEVILSLLDGDKATNATPQRSGGSNPESVCPSCGIERAGECRDPWHGLFDDSLTLSKDQGARSE